MFKFMFSIIFCSEAKPQTPIIQLSKKTLIDNYYPGLCQHKIQPLIYPQQVLELCHLVTVSTIHLFQQK